MTRLPTPGGDAGNWGTILNEYLSTVHNTDGSLKPGVVAGSHLADGSITTDKLADASITTTKLASSVQSTLSSVVTTSTVGAAGGIASLDSSGKVPASQLPIASGGTVPVATASVSGTIQLTGDLGGSASSPTVTKLSGVSLSGTPSAGQALVATSSTAAGWQTVSTAVALGGTLWSTDADPAVNAATQSSVEDGDMWVDRMGDPFHVRLRANGAWVSIANAPKPTATTTTAPLASTTQPETTDTSVTLHWTAPSQVAGTLNGYNVYEGSSTTPLNSSLIAAGTTSFTTTTALIPGTNYSFIVKAVSTPTGGSQTESAGLTIQATTTGSVATPLAAPTGVTATAGDASAAVSFGLVTEATSYTVTSNPGGITNIGATSPIVVEGLANGTSYTFTVSATDGTRTSAESAPSGAVVPSGVSGGVDTTTFMTRQGDKLYLGNTQWRGTGINLPWSLGCAKNDFNRPPTDAEVTTMFQNAKPYSIYRFWAYANYSIAAVKHLMDLGRPYGHRFIPVLADGAAGCGDPYNPYPQNHFNDNFTSTWPNTTWKNNWLTPVINYFKNDPVIGWYEWMNEPVNTQSTVNFYSGVGDYVRNTLADTNHLIGTGTMSIYNGDQNIRKALNGLSTVDVCSMHEYDGTQAASSHTPKDAACAAAAGKPFIVGEFGIKTSEVSNRANQIRTKIQAYRNYPTCAAVIYWSGQSPSATEWASYEISVTNSSEINVINTEPF